MTRSFVELYDWKTPTCSPSMEERIPYHDTKGKFDFQTRKPDITLRVALTSMSQKELREEGLIREDDHPSRSRRYYRDRNGVLHAMDVTRIKRQGQEQQRSMIGVKMRFNPNWLNILNQYTPLDSEIIVL